MYKKIIFALAINLTACYVSNAQYFSIQQDTMYKAVPDLPDPTSASTAVGFDRPIHNISSSSISIDWEYFLNPALIDTANVPFYPTGNPIQACLLCSPMMGCIPIYRNKNLTGNTGTINPGQTVYFEFSADIFHDTINRPFLHGIALKYNTQRDTIYYITELKAAGPSNASNVKSISNDIKVYPNPIQNECNIESAAPINDIMLFDLNGRIQLRKTFSNTTKIKLNLSEFAKGNYILILNQQQGMSQKMIQIQ